MWWVVKLSKNGRSEVKKEIRSQFLVWHSNASHVSITSDIMSESGKCEITKGVQNARGKHAAKGQTRRNPELVDAIFFKLAHSSLSPELCE